MNILIDVKHPAHVHFFRNAITEFKKRGHKVLVTASDKDITLKLLRQYNIPYKKISDKRQPGIVAMFVDFFGRGVKFYNIAKKFKADITLELMGVTGAPVARILGIPSLVFYDTENARLTNWFAYLTCTYFVTPECYRVPLGKKQIKYQGYHELNYLYRFKPKASVLKKAGVKKGEIFTIMRFVSWGASHDLQHTGLSAGLKEKAVEEFSKYGKVLITSEKALPKKLEPYRYKAPVEDIHSLMAYATLLYGESATMASEASMLGTYSIYIDDEGRGYTDEQEEKYGLVSNYSESIEDQKKSIKKGASILKNKNSKKAAQKKSAKLLKDSVDVTKFVVELTERFK